MTYSVVIPSKNIDNLLPCVRAIHTHDPGCRTIIVDDGLVLDPWPEVLDGSEIVKGIKPFIFSRAMNCGIRRAIEIDATVSGFLLTNDDALLETPGGFSLLAREAEAHPEYGIIASTCDNVGNPNQWPQGIGLREDSRMVCFVSVLIPRRTIEAVGLLDEEFTGYGLDDDSYSLRVRRAGLKIGIHDGCHVDHGSLKSSFRGAAGAGGDFRPNLKIFIAKYGCDNWGRTKETSEFPELFP